MPGPRLWHPEEALKIEAARIVAVETIIAGHEAVSVDWPVAGSAAEQVLKAAAELSRQSDALRENVEGCIARVRAA